jgi:hypothetical protein
MGLLEKYSDRSQEMQLGIRELEAWLLDTVEQGLAQLPSLSKDAFDDIASRLVDLKLGGIARRIRSFEQLRHEEHWRKLSSSFLAELYFFVQRFQKMDKLPSEQQIDLLLQGGVNLQKKDVITHGEPIDDYWIVLGLEMGIEERIRFRRTWIWGENSQQAALILDFAWGSEPFEGHYVVGAALQAQVIYYPGAHNTRVLIQDPSLKNQPFAQLDGYDSLESFTLHYANLLREAPAIIAYPVLLNQVICFAKEGQFFIVDQDKHYLELDIEDFSGWQLVAASAGYPITAFATYDGFRLKPLSAIVNERVVKLTAN